MRMMVKIPSKKEGISVNNAPLEAIRKINDMFKALTNKIPVKIGPWQFTAKLSIKPTSSELFLCLPEDVNVGETYVYDYRRFIRAGKSCYFRFQLFYDDDTTILEIKSIAAQFKQPKEIFLEVPFSDVVSPVHIGTLTGSVAEMAKSVDFYEVFKSKFKLTDLGLWFAIPRKSDGGEWTKNKSSLHIEINRSDLQKRKIIEVYFNQSSRSLDNTFFGIPIFLTPAFDYSAEDEIREKLNNHTRKQASLGKSLRSITISGIRVSNWADRSKESTILRELMAVESIHDKKVVKGKT